MLTAALLTWRGAAVAAAVETAANKNDENIRNISDKCEKEVVKKTHPPGEARLKEVTNN